MSDQIHPEEMTEPAETAPQSYWIDHLRIFAALAVVMVHTASGVLAKEDDINSAHWWFGMIYFSVGRWCVPVFVMLSGYLLLDPTKEEPLSEFFRKRASRLVVPLLFWSLFYTGWWAFRQTMTSTPFTIQEGLIRLVSGSAYYHLWYLYMLLGLYFVTPWLRRTLRGISQREITVLVLVTLIPGVLTYLLNEYQRPLDTSVYGSTRDGLWLNWFLYYLPYYLAGMALGRVLSPLPKRITTVVLLLSIVLTAVGSNVVDRIPELADMNYFVGYVSVTTVPMSICVFSLFMTTSRPLLGQQLTKRLAALTFGIYLLHPMFLDGAKFVGLDPYGFPSIVSVPLVTAVVFLASAVTAQLMNLFAWTRRLI